MTCREFVDFLMEYLEQSLPQTQREVFEGHLGECPGCVTYLETYRETLRLEKSLCGDDPDAPIPEDVPERLVAAILAARSAES